MRDIRAIFPAPHGHPVVYATLLGLSLGIFSGFPVTPARAEKPAAKRDLTSLQEEFLKCRFGLFACFDMATFVGYGHTNGYEDPALFNPNDLDCGQWADEAKAAHMGYAVLTAKNTGGWCLWDSKYTTHDIAQAKNFRAGKGDVVREFVDAFRARGIKVGLYYCFPGNFSKPDLVYQRTVPKGEVDLHALPPEARGNRVEFMKKQLVELLDNYGPIQLLWIDQWGTDPKISAQWKAIKDDLNTTHPDCLIIGNNAHNFGITDIVSHELPITYVEQLAEGNRRPSEVCDSMYGATWFWRKGPYGRIAQRPVARWLALRRGFARG